MGNYSNYNQGVSSGGIHNTANVDLVGMNPTKDSFSRQILKMQNGGNSASLFTMLDAMTSNNGGKVTDVNVTWHSQTDQFLPACTVTETVTGGNPESQVIKVDRVDGFMAGKILVNECTSEHLHIIAVPDANTIVVSQGMGTTPISPIMESDRLTLLTNVMEESSLRPNSSMSENIMTYSNVTQIFRNTWAVSGSEREVQRLNGENTISRGFKQGMFQHQLEVEQAILFGQKWVGEQNGNPMRIMDGVVSQIKKYAPENVWVANGQTNLNQLETMLDCIHQVDAPAEYQNNGESVIMTGNRGYKVFSDILKTGFDAARISTGTTEYGYRVTTFHTSLGTFHCVINPLFNTNPAWGNLMLILNMKALKLLPLGARVSRHSRFNMNSNGQLSETQVDNGIDAMGGTFTAEYTLKNFAPKTMAVIYNVCSACLNPPMCVVDAPLVQNYTTDRCGRIIPKLDMIKEGRLDFACEKSCNDGDDLQEFPTPLKWDECGNLICEVPCNEEEELEVDCVPYSVSGIITVIDTITTSLGDIEIGCDLSTLEGLENANEILTAFLAENSPDATGHITFEAPDATMINIACSCIEFLTVKAHEIDYLFE